MLQENPIWNDEAYSKDVRGPDAYEQMELLQDKSTAAIRWLSDCLHIQELLPEARVMSPRWVQVISRTDEEYL
ncbi:hypothetical protein, partial [Bradyrhizobium sp. SZCCHNR3015]|uniref:hypothetical protein n=1 Tax=Bradyrhizobium sp. SZCCHNR3015 TaxID=3057395 RepID=UPI0029167CB9